MLKRREDVLAVGVAGSVAYGDTWPGSDLDIEVVLKGDRPKQVVNTEQEISVDYGYFGENHMAEIPYDTRPVYDPSGVLGRELNPRNRDEIIERDIKEAIEQCGNLLRRADEALKTNHYSALVLLHLVAASLAISFTLAADENRTIRRAVSRLEKATAKTGRRDFLENFSTLFGFPATLEQAGMLLSELEAGYKEIWGYFKDKPMGPGYMQLQPDSEAWFRNRIRPVYEYDKRDLAWIVYSEFPFVLYYCFGLAGHERTPIDVFGEAAKLEGPPSLWVARHQRILKLFNPDDVPSLLETARTLVSEVQQLSEARLWTRDG